MEIRLADVWRCMHTQRLKDIKDGIFDAEMMVLGIKSSIKFPPVSEVASTSFIGTSYMLP